jgi:hypothetical protein
MENLKVFLVAALVLLTAACGLSEEPVESQPSSLTVAHEQLAEAMVTNTLAAQKKYNGKVITVTGRLFIMGRNQQGKHTHFLETILGPDPSRAAYTTNEDPMQAERVAKVSGRCSFDEKQRDELAKLTTTRLQKIIELTDTVRIKGKIEIKDGYHYVLTGCALQ